MAQEHKIFDLVFDDGAIDAKKTGYRAVAEYVIHKYDIVRVDDMLMKQKRRYCRIYEQYTKRINNCILLKELKNSTRNYRNEVFYYIVSLAPKIFSSNENKNLYIIHR